MITEWQQVGKDWIALNEYKAVCGLLKRLDDEIPETKSITPQMANSEAREAYTKVIRWKGGD